jgi:hypothetical protein
MDQVNSIPYRAFLDTYRDIYTGKTTRIVIVEQNVSDWLR